MGTKVLSTGQIWSPDHNVMMASSPGPLWNSRCWLSLPTHHCQYNNLVPGSSPSLYFLVPSHTPWCFCFGAKTPLTLWANINPLNFGGQVSCSTNSRVDDTARYLESTYHHRYTVTQDPSFSFLEHHGLHLWGAASLKIISLGFYFIANIFPWALFLHSYWYILILYVCFSK